MVTHRYWAGPEPSWLPAYDRSWERHGGDVRSWSPETLPGDVAEWAAANMPGEVPADHLPQHDANLVRLGLLWHHGGLWVDADCHARRPLWPLLPPDRAAMAAQRGTGLLVNSVLWVPGAHHPFIGAARAAIETGETDPSTPAAYSGTLLLRGLADTHDVAALPLCDCAPGAAPDDAFVVHRRETGPHRA